MQKQLRYLSRAGRVVLLSAAMVALADGTLAAEQITAQEAHDIGVDAYLYFYPLVTTDVTRKQLTNVEPGKGIGDR
jgi:hypothetical protein